LLALPGNVLSIGKKSNTGTPDNGQPLNVLLITADDLGYEAVDFLKGKVKGVMPNLDKLCSQSVSFRHGFMNAAICAPSRGIIATGRYGHNSGLFGFNKLSIKIQTLFGTFQKAGYLTGILGKVSHSTPDASFQWDFVHDIKELGGGRRDFIKQGLIGASAGLENQKIAVKESRLGIPLISGRDVIHGFVTTFPIPLAMSCMWDVDRIEKSARIAAEEASASGICWTYSPMVDICRDPRWGRIAEGSGEDPWLGAQMAKAYVRGYQGNDLSKENTIMACVKHFALYGAAEAGRDYNTVDMSRRKMLQDYLPPYKAAIDAGAGSVMSSFNLVDGIPATGNKWLITDLLRNNWGFDGFVVTDYTAINEMMNHGVGATLQDVSVLALKAGIDLDMVGQGYISTLGKSLDEGKVTMYEIDLACRRMLEAKYKLGLFKNPFQYYRPDKAKGIILSAENLAAARDIARRSIVLLKNSKNLLPLKTEGKIAVVSPGRFLLRLMQAT
jgi:beta-glucosidase-like glycosyl hydrolase